MLGSGDHRKKQHSTVDKSTVTRISQPMNLWHSLEVI